MASPGSSFESVVPHNWEGWQQEREAAGGGIHSQEADRARRLVEGSTVRKQTAVNVHTQLTTFCGQFRNQSMEQC